MFRFGLFPILIESYGFIKELRKCKVLFISLWSHIVLFQDHMPNMQSHDYKIASIIHVSLKY